MVLGGSLEHREFHSGEPWQFSIVSGSPRVCQQSGLESCE